MQDYGLFVAIIMSILFIRLVWNSASNALGEIPANKVLTNDPAATYYKGKGGGRDETEGMSIQEVKSIVWQRDNGLCVHCGAECYLGRRTAEDLKRGRVKGFFGHWLANAIGGPEVPGNLHISCVGCNSDMGSAVILQPAIDFAASRGETICTAGLEVYEGVYRITELLERAAA